MRTIVKVESNIKSKTGKRWSCELRPKTVISGPVGSGKTAIVSAIELALTGQASDVLFKDPKDPSALLALAPAKAKDLYAAVTFDDGEQAIFAMEIKPDGRACKPDIALPSWWKAGNHVLPMRAMKGLFDGSPERAVEKLLGVVTQAPVAELSDLLAGALTKRTLPLATELLDDEPRPAAGMTVSWVWTTLLAKAKRKKLDAQAAARAAEAQSKKVVDAGDVVTDADIEAAERAYQDAVADIPSKMWALAVLGSQLEEAEAALAEAQAEPAPAVERSYEDLEGQVRQTESILNVLLDSVGGCCVACGAPPSPKRPQPKNVQAHLDALRATLAKATAAMPQRSKAEQAQSVVDTLNTKYAKLYEGIQALGVDPAETDVPASQPAQAAARAALAALHALEDRRRAQTSTKKAAGTLAKDLRDDAARYAELEAECEEAQRDLLAGALDKLNDKINTFMPKKWKASLNVSRAGATVFEPCIIKDGVIGPAISGCEGQTILGALALATMPASVPYACLIPDDRDRGLELQTWMVAWMHTDVQVIVTTAAGYVPQVGGWSVVETANLR